MLSCSNPLQGQASQGTDEEIGPKGRTLATTPTTSCQLEERSPALGDHAGHWLEGKSRLATSARPDMGAWHRTVLSGGAQGQEKERRGPTLLHKNSNPLARPTSMASPLSHGSGNRGVFQEHLSLERCSALVCETKAILGASPGSEGSRATQSSVWRKKYQDPL